MLALTTVNTLSPHLEAGEFHMLTHNFYYFRSVDAKLSFDHIKSCPVFPSHSDNAVDFGLCKFLIHHFSSIKQPCLNRILMMVFGAFWFVAVIDLAAGRFEFRGLLAHADCQRLFRLDILSIGVIANVLGDLHRAEMRAAH